MTVLRLARSGWAALLPSLLLALLVFHEGLTYLVWSWGEREEYGYAYLIPLIAAFLVWQRRDLLAGVPLVGSWAGAATVMVGLLLFIAGQLGTLYVLQQYAFIIVVFGVALAYTGWRALSIIWMAPLLLLFMVPLPDFLNIQLSEQLQLLSSRLGVAVMRLFGVSVFLEGNVIDLGAMQLQVAEACSGLRYLFPLMTLGFILSLFHRAPLWRRLTLFAATVPITVLMNGLRIGIIGVLVDNFGIGQAQGFLHYFEGWVVFMACLGLLLAVMWLLARLSGDRRPWRELLVIGFPSRKSALRKPLQPAQTPMWAAVLLLAAATIPAALLPHRAEAAPARKDFGEFPLEMAGWSGHRGQLDRVYVDFLRATDYVLADYVRGGDTVNLYVSYYESQRNGGSAHSPRVCLPGGGWVIEQFSQRTVAGAAVGGQALRVNRALISHGADRQLVYYWFQERGRALTNEYLVKWFLFWDSLTRNRTDGSLVRLITPVRPGGEAARADAVLEGFVRAAQPRLSAYLPD